MPKKKENKKKYRSIKEIVDSFNNARSEQKVEFVNALEKALNFNPKKKK